MRAWIAVAGFLLIVAVIGVTVYFGGETSTDDDVKGVRVAVASGEVMVKNGTDAKNLHGGEELHASADGSLTTSGQSAGGERIASVTESGEDLSLASKADGTEITAATAAPFWVTGYSRQEDKTPLAGTQISAYSRLPGRPKHQFLFSTMTNEEGYYAIDLQKTGKFYLLADPREDLTEEAAYLTFEATETALTQDFVHRPAGLSMKGRVVNAETDKPIEGAEVQLQLNPITVENVVRHKPSGVSGADGSFIIRRVAEGNYLVQATAKGFMDCNPQPWVDSSDPLGSVQVNDHTQNNEVLVKMKPGASVIVRCVDTNQKPVAQARVEVVMRNVDFSASSLGYTDDKGEWRTDSAAKGKALVVAKKESLATTTSEVFETGTLENPAEVEITLGEPGSISGTVSYKDGRPANRHIVWAFNRTLKGLIGRDGIISYSTADTNEIGYYKIKDLGPAEYLVRVNERNEQGGYSNQDKNVSKNLTLKAGESRTDVNFVLDVSEDHEIVQGKVVDQSGKPVPGIQVLVHIQDSSLPPERRTFKTGNTNEMGEFEIGGLPKVSKFTVSVWADGYKKFMKEFNMDGAPVLITLEAGGSIAGVVIAKDTREPVGGAQLVLRSLTDLNYHSPGTATNVEGQFKFENLAPGIYLAEASAKNYVKAQSAQLAVETGKNIEDAVIEMESGLTFTGRLLDPQGQPVAGANVGLLSYRTQAYRPIGIYRPAEEIPNSVLSDGEGVFRVAIDAQKGDTLIIRPAVLAPRLMPVSSDAVSLEPVPIPLTPGGMVEGTVWDAHGQPAANVQIGVFDDPQQFFPQTASTDDQGRYRFEHVPAGSMLVLKYSAGGSEESDYKRAAVVEGQSVTVDFGGEGAVIHGTVTRGGRIVPGAPVLLTGKEGRQYQQFAVTGEDGGYEFKGVEEGEYQIVFAATAGSDRLTPYSADGMRDLAVTREQKDYLVNLVVFIREVAGKTVDAQTGQPVPWVDVRPLIPDVNQYDAMAYPSPTKSTEDGSFKLVLRKPGTYTLVASKSGYTNEHFEIVHSEEEVIGGVNEPISVEVRMTSSENAVDAFLTFNGRPVNPEQIEIMTFAGGAQAFPYEADPGQPGLYHITGLPAGLVSLLIYALWNDHALMAFPDPVAAQPGQTLSLPVNLTEMISYQLMLNTPDGSPLPSDASAYHFEIPEYPRFANAPLGVTSAGDLRYYTLSVPAGPTRVILKVRGYRPIDFIPAAIAEPYYLPRIMKVTMKLERE